MQIGHSSKLIYDEQAYQDKLMESVSPLGYQLNPYHKTNCNACLSIFGPRAGLMGEGVSTVIPTGSTRRIAPVNDVIDIESLLTNRNLKLSKTKMGEVNDIDVTKFKLTHSDICDEFLNPLSSKLSYPAYELRGAPINRFYDLQKNPQENIFYDFAINTKLEAKDNFVAEIPKLQKTDQVQPVEYMNKTNSNTRSTIDIGRFFIENKEKCEADEEYCHK